MNNIIGSILRRYLTKEEFARQNYIVLQEKIDKSKLWQFVKHEPYVAPPFEPIKSLPKVSPPRSGDRVTQFVTEGDNREGVILWISNVDDAVNVKFFKDNSVEEFSCSDFEGNYMSKGGRTQWQI